MWQLRHGVKENWQLRKGVKNLLKTGHWVLFSPRNSKKHDLEAHFRMKKQFYAFSCVKVVLELFFGRLPFLVSKCLVGAQTKHDWQMGKEYYFVYSELSLWKTLYVCGWTQTHIDGFGWSADETSPTDQEQSTTIFIVRLTVENSTLFEHSNWNRRGKTGFSKEKLSAEPKRGTKKNGCRPGQNNENNKNNENNNGFCCHFQSGRYCCTR